MSAGIIFFSGLMASARLPGKALTDLEGTSLLSRVVDRAWRLGRGMPMTIATSNRRNEGAHISAMLVLREEFNLPVGCSDHTVRSDAIEVAVAMGAEIIEKHFTDTREGKEFRDHKVSLTREEVVSVLKKFGKIKTLQGRKEKCISDSELRAGHHISFRRSLYTVRNIRKGEPFTSENLTFLRPATGCLRFIMRSSWVKKPLETFGPMKF